MNALEARIAALIAAQGPISVAHFMTLALHDAEGGYYATRQPFGAAGDFITAPEISQMFGEMLGLWCVQVWHDQGQPKQKRLVELGPGRGTLMADALRAAKAAPEFLVGLEVVLIEASPVLREAQAQGKRVSDHLSHLVIHGGLHLLGYDHEHPGDARRMEMEEAQLMSQLHRPNPWKPDSGRSA